MILGKNIKKKSLKNGPETIIHVNSKKKKRETKRNITGNHRKINPSPEKILK